MKTQVRTAVTINEKPLQRVWAVILFHTFKMLKNMTNIKCTKTRQKVQ